MSVRSLIDRTSVYIFLIIGAVELMHIRSSFEIKAHSNALSSFSEPGCRSMKHYY